MMRKRTFIQWGKKVLAGALCVSLFLQPLAASAAEMANQPSATVAVASQQGNQPQTATTNHIAPHIYENGIIKIYNEKQLEKIGSGQPVTDTDDKASAFGQGTALAVDGQLVEYSMDGQYQLMNDISLDSKAMWQLPDGFSGHFVGEAPAANAPLYEKSTDTIYVYHSYQLQTIASADGETAPVMTQDATVEDYGIGQLVYPNGDADAQSYLTYSKRHQYVLSKHFTEKRPPLKSATAFATQTPFEKPLVATDPQLGGRQHIGQVYTTINGEKHILIGNEQQLQAIGSGKHVTPMLFVRTEVSFVIGLIKKVTIIPYYPGDADFNLRNIDQTKIKYQDIDAKTKEFQYFKQNPTPTELMDADLEDPGLLGAVVGILGTVLDGVLSILAHAESQIVGLKDENTANPSIGKKEGGFISGPSEFTSYHDLKATYKNLKYDTDQNYIVFRDIDCKSMANWQPLHFSGHLEGQLYMQPGVVPTIKNINVHQTGALNVEKDCGIGFFGSISSAVDPNTLNPARTVVVKNLHLDQVTVKNDSSTVSNPPTSLVDALLQLVGGLLGGLTNLLGLKLGDVLQNLLTLRQSSEDIFATGCFVGNVKGDVQITNCKVTNGTVSSVKGLCGGFVGYSEGVEKYDGLSGILGTVVQALAKLLNILPGVGLGDLITVLLENDVPLGNLIPVGYYKPAFNDCLVDFGATGTSVGSASTDYNGGFIGAQVSTDTQQCEAIYIKQVQAQNGAGGFAGIMRDDIIAGALNDVGVNIATFDIQSKQTDCTVSGNHLVVEAVATPTAQHGEYAGGFNGAMTYGASSGCKVVGLSKVVCKNYGGGFAGRATIGYGATIGQKSVKKSSLLSAVNRILGLLVKGDQTKLHNLLSITGNLPSSLEGCVVDGATIVVQATKNYAGGFIGSGEGVNVNVLTPTAQTRVSQLKAVKADNYAGGFAGAVSTANPIGVLNNTLGVGKYLAPDLKHITVHGVAWETVATHKNASGGIGLLVGGQLEDARIEGLSKVTAGNYAAGVIGRAGTGGLAAEKGLDLLGLGLIKVDNVLSLAQGVAVQVKDVHLLGEGAGLTVTANGNAEVTDAEPICAGGFASEAEGIDVLRCDVKNLQAVTATTTDQAKKTFAGGFMGRSHTGGLAGLAQAQADGSFKLPGIVSVNSLLNLVPYLLPTYTGCQVYFVSNADKPQVKADCAGGFVAHMQSGEVKGVAPTPSPAKTEQAVTTTPSVDAQAETAAPTVPTEQKVAAPTKLYAVEGLELVEGADAAGGFAGLIEAGAVAKSGGLSVLGGVTDLNLNGILSALDVYIPKVSDAGVHSAKDGCVIRATGKESVAGGYAGAMSGAHVRNSDVNTLKHTKVVPPLEGLEASNGSSYFDAAQSTYAVTAGKYAGGYVGRADIDSAASVGSGLSLLGKALSLTNVLTAIDAVATKVTDSDVYGAWGGFSVLANGQDAKNNIRGMAGGFSGRNSGSQMTNCHVHDFNYIVGQEAAGGYAGLIEPGDVASVVEDTGILGGLLNGQEAVASLINSFIPIIKDSSTTCVPCGGAVRAESATDTALSRGMAGGYVGYNHGGRIIGENKECAAVRIRSVYGREFAGGYTGLMETADIASTGNLSVLYGLLDVSNVLGVLGAVYPTETNTAVYGPLRQIDMETWNGWSQAIGQDGVYGTQLPNQPVQSQAELDALIKQYAYGYNVKAGRDSVGTQAHEAGVAGGYVGRMKSGVVTEAHAWDAKNVTAYQSAGGFAGEMLTGGVAEVGKVSLLGLDLTGTLGAVQTFVPVVRNADITGFQSGLSVRATGVPQPAGSVKVEKLGHAGGYVGRMIGGQIWGNWKKPGTRATTDAVPDAANNRCFVDNLRRVDGTQAVGGFAGLVEPGSAAALDTASSSGLLGGLLQHLVGTPGDLLKVLDATVATVQASDVKAWHDYGIIINGVYNDAVQPQASTKYAKAVGGFVGEANGAVFGKLKDKTANTSVQCLRSVTGGEHVGGYVGLANVSAVAQVSAGNTSILHKLVTLGSTNVLDSFRTYVYDGAVNGAPVAGLEVNAKEGKPSEYINDPVYSGNAGGFAGSLLNGSVKRSTVTDLRQVNGLNYTGGFVGHLGKSGAVDLDSLGVLKNLVDLGAGVLDIFGSHVENSSVSGLNGGFTVSSDNRAHEKSEISGGFAGYAALAKLDHNVVVDLKQVYSGTTAGGFAGKTDFEYLVNLNGNSILVNKLVDLLNRLLKALWVEDLQAGKLIHINLGILKVDALYDGNLVHVNLLGLDIAVALNKAQQLATIYIGDSKIEVNCAPDGSIQSTTDNKKNLNDEVKLALIKANRTRINDCTVTGIAEGYDVYGAGADNAHNGNNPKGHAGGFVGWNNEGLLKGNDMFYADVVRGVEKTTGPFTGFSVLDSNWNFNTLFGIEGDRNNYRIYREPDPSFDKIVKNVGGTELQSAFQNTGTWDIYKIAHMTQGKVERFKDLAGAKTSSATATKPLDAYMENGAMAVLMNNTPTAPTPIPEGEREPADVQDPCADTVKLSIQKVWKHAPEHKRPDSITFTITRSYKDASGQEVQDTSFQDTVTMSKADYQTETTWKRVISSPNYLAYKVGTDGKTKYNYTYHVSEAPLEGYETTITYNDTYHYSTTVTNRLMLFGGLLPNTGGSGTKWFIISGLLLIAAALVVKRRRAYLEGGDFPF